MLRKLRLYALALVCSLVATASYADSDDPDTRSVLRVCADGNYMPMSNRAGQGYENRIAALLAAELDIALDYYWFPQRLGFIRNTLKKKNPAGGYMCDVVMGVPDRYELVITTEPYMRSTYVLAYLKGAGLDDIATQADFLALDPQRKAQLKIGAHERNPGIRLLADNNMYAQLVPYVAQGGDPNVAPAQRERDDLLSGKIDMAILWGPLAAQLKTKSSKEVVLVPLESTGQLRFHFPFSLGVRHPDKHWRDQLNQLIESKQADIQEILNDYGIPLVDESGKLL